MEDMARLAILEQNIQNTEVFSKTLLKLLEYIGYILENPHDYELRTISSDYLKQLLSNEGVADYLIYIGFQINGKEIVYPNEISLNKLRMAQAAIERKLYFCHGSVSATSVNNKSSQSQPRVKKVKLSPSRVLTTTNQFLQKVEGFFNDILQYEDEALQQEARDQIPLVTLQLKAIDRMREHQRKLKKGEIKGDDMNFDIALLMELLGWFKYSFFQWVDKPDCEQCGNATVFQYTQPLKTETETCRLEVYKCTVCPGSARFARHNEAGAVLRNRRGRCGEWASCFVLLCRALGYDTRHVWDVTDHVWCEVYDYDSNQWLHVDPCEAKLNAPLMYEHGWGKKLQYVVAFSRDDVQDVTWRYSSKHAEVKTRRKLCSETELVQTILTLREHRQRQVSEVRRRYLAKRTVRELLNMMVERKPSDYESHGRISGSKEWRTERGEIGKSHSFDFTETGTYCVNYHSSKDQYTVSKDARQIESISGWQQGIFESSNVFRKEEKDWRMVYLAREEGCSEGHVCWRMSTPTGLVMTLVSVKGIYKLYENANITWTIQLDEEEPKQFQLDDPYTQFKGAFKSVTLKAQLSGGQGEVSWQHAQLFRQSMDDQTSAFQVTIHIDKTK